MRRNLAQGITMMGSGDNRILALAVKRKRRMVPKVRSATYAQAPIVFLWSFSGIGRLVLAAAHNRFTTNP